MNTKLINFRKARVSISRSTERLIEMESNSHVRFLEINFHNVELT